MKLNFISTETLLPFNSDKHFGMFVYLMKDNEEFKKGLYIGGINGWEKLTNDSYDAIKYIADPIASVEEYIYNGQEQEYFPFNWEKISEFVSINNNVNKDAGSYETIFSINESSEDRRWFDAGDKEDKTLSWEIKKFEIPSEKISVEFTLDSYNYSNLSENIIKNLTIGADAIFDNVFVTNGALNKDCYEVIKEGDWTTAGEKTLKIKINEESEFSKNYHFAEIVKKVKFEKFKLTLPTWNTDGMTFQRVREIKYNEYVGDITPENWISLVNNCTILYSDKYKNDEGNGYIPGEYTVTISLKDPANYCWDNPNNEEGVEDDRVVLLLNVKYPVPKPDTEYNVSYNEKEQNITSISEFNSWYNVNKDYCDMIPNMVESPREVGTYTYTLKLKTNCAWEDGSTDDVIVTLTISPKIVENPNWDGVLTEYEYTGNEVKPVPSNWDIIKTYCNISYSASPKEIGTYTCNITLNENYAWESGNTGTTFIFTIKTQEVPIYWGYTNRWSSTQGTGTVFLKDALSNGELPSDKIEASITDNGDGTKSFVISANEWVNEGLCTPGRVWWFAIPVDKTITGGKEYAESVNANYFNTSIIKNSNVSENENNENLIINGYYIVADKDSKIVMASNSQTEHNITVIYK